MGVGEWTGKGGLSAGVARPNGARLIRRAARLVRLYQDGGRAPSEVEGARLLITLRLLLTALVLSVASGCAGGARVAGPGDLADLNLDLAGRRVTVVLADGSRQRAEALRVEADSASWFDLDARVMRAVPTASVVEIRHSRPERVTRTVGWSIAVGVVAGAVGDGGNALSAIEAGMLGGMAGAFFGLAYGVATDTETRILLRPSPPAWAPPPAAALNAPPPEPRSQQHPER